jgi:HD-GYP domain-containing protein (c-di-GMP phosphodiesterase class II)
MPWARVRLSLHAYISALFLALLFAFAAVAIGVQYTRTKSMLLSSATELSQRIGQQVKSEVEGIGTPARLTAQLLSRSGIVLASDTEARLTFVPLMIQALRGGSALSFVYVGFEDGDFFGLRPIDPESNWARSIRPPKRAAYLIQSVAHDPEGLKTGRFLFLDLDGQLLEDRGAANYFFDPRVRPWYALAEQSTEAVRTNPYLFFTTRQVGITFSQRSADAKAVIGVDVTLDALSDLLRKSKPTASALLAVTNQSGEVLASSAASLPLVVDDIGNPRLSTLHDLHQPVMDALAGDHEVEVENGDVVSAGGEKWQTYYAPLTANGERVNLLLAAPQDELLAGADRIRLNMLLVSLAALAIAIPIALAVSKLISQSLDRLTAEAKEISALHFDKPFNVHSPIIEIDRLAHAMGSMKVTIHRLLTIGAALGGEKRFDRLLDRIVAETIDVAGAHGGLVYLTDPDGTLKGGLARWDGHRLQAPPRDLQRGRDDDHPAVQAAEGANLQNPIAPDEMAKWFPDLADHKPLNIIAVPLKNRQDDVVGVLVLFQPADVTGGAARSDVMSLVEAVSGTAAVAIETNRLIEEQKHLVQGIIELVAGAIDAKSPYTGGHCQRVPELTEMLAHAAADATDGKFRDFRLSDEQWEELHIAGWLHDCGKVTSPEYVIDKATKLETIYDRLHEIRMRFEVAKREAEVACWKEIAAGAMTERQRQDRFESLRALWRELDDEFTFVATCNVGGEFMAPERVERIKSIARRSWTRTIDDRIGLSHEETERRRQEPAAPLPTLEPLLADRPEHVIRRDERDKLTADNPWGFKVQVPEHLYNRGEIYNLTIARGTLSEEERFKINEHMIETIKMLARLPLPRHMRNVLEVAGGHHEKMDGTGYPRRLRREDMSIPARMMAIADIFEALTAADRPYKKAKSLSESIGIMAKMRDDAHIDADLFDLFLASGVYRAYAEKFLKPEQIDDVPVGRFMSAA